MFVRGLVLAVMLFSTLASAKNSSVGTWNYKKSLIGAHIWQHQKTKLRESLCKRWIRKTLIV